MTAQSPDDPNTIDPASTAADATAHSLARQDVSRHVTMERVETVPMTPNEYEAAVAALAELVLQWERKGAPNTAPKKAA